MWRTRSQLSLCLKMTSPPTLGSILQTGVGWERWDWITHTPKHVHAHAQKSVTELLPVCPSVHLPCKAHVRRPPHEVQCWSPPDSSWWRHTADTCCPEATRFYDVGNNDCLCSIKCYPIPISTINAVKRYLRAVVCMMAVRKDCGLKKPANHTVEGNRKSDDQASSSLILASRSMNHKVRPDMDG